MARERKKSGDPLKLSSADWNSFLDAADRVLGGKINRHDRNTVRRGNEDVLGRNTTGVTLPAFSIVGLDAVMVPTPTDSLVEFKQQNHLFDIVVPLVPDHIGKWGVTQEPLIANAVGRVRIDGIAIAQITGTIPPETPYFAECNDSVSTGLVYRASGSAQVLYSDPGSNWAVIRLSNASREEIVKIVSDEQDANGFYDGIVQRYDISTFSWQDMYACKVVDANA